MFLFYIILSELDAYLTSINAELINSFTLITLI